MPASLTNQVRLGYSMGWRIWTPNEVGFYAKTLAHSYFILIILKSKFLKNKLWIVNYNLFIGSRKYYVFVEFLKFGIKSKEERSYWKKILYISLLVRHTSFTAAYKQFRSKKGFKLKAIKRYIKLYIRKYKRGRKWDRFKKKNILKKVIGGGKPKFLVSVKFYKSILNKKLNKKIKSNFYNFKVKKKNKKKLYSNLFRKFILSISNQKFSFKDKLRFKKTFTHFKKKKIFYKLKKKTNKFKKIPTLLSFKFFKKNKNFLLKATKLLTSRLTLLKKNNKLVFLNKKNSKLKLTKKAYRLKKKIVTRKLVCDNKYLKQYLSKIRLKIKKQKLFNILNNKNFIFKKSLVIGVGRLKRYKYLRDNVVFGIFNKKLINSKKNYINRNNNILMFLFKKKLRIRPGIKKNMLKSYPYYIHSEGFTSDVKFDTLRTEVVFEKFRSKPYDLAREFSITAGPRKRLSRNLKRAFLGKHLKFILNLIWFWEKIARLVSYYAGYAKFLQSYKVAFK